MTKHFRIGVTQTRTGAWHAEQVASALKPSNCSSECIQFENVDDLEKALVEGAIDLMVTHPNFVLNAADEVELIAITERQPVNDCTLISNSGITLTDSELKVATNSALRLAFLSHYYPHAIGTLASAEDCIATLKTNHCDLAVMGFDEALPFLNPEIVYEKIETSYFVPTLGQGALAIFCHKKLNFNDKEILQRWVNHEESEDCIRTEWMFHKTLPYTDGLLPFSYAHFEGPLITLKAGLISADGKEIFKSKKSAALGEAKELGKKVAFETARLLSEQRVQFI